MAISQSEYNSIMRIYDERQANGEFERQNRIAKIYQEHPDLKEVQDQITTCRVNETRATLLHHSKEVAQYQKDYQLLKEKKQRLMEAYHITESDFERHYICPDCKDTGYTSDGEFCHCFHQAMIDRLSAESNIKELVKEHNFSNFRLDYYDDHLPLAEFNNQTQRQLMEATLNYCQTYMKEFDQTFRNLLFYGNTGVGKTFLTHCIAKEMLDLGYSVLYLSAKDMCELLIELSFSKGELDPGKKKLSHLIYHCDLLILDDLGSEFPNAMSVSALFDCLDKRINRKKSTILSTNLSPNQLKKIYTDRIFSRLTGYYSFTKVIGNDNRMKHMD